ncbi:hypothetical protein [Novacetimonas pomaceti]|uniref:hypothetical protein n=1 Tax=Novacetimonas pomaceti TaxID=2021998 RepID=UPI001C2D61ED|nr:hypothetical protein [Novacetimonas pomaceti]MBV1835105.1 hypothetical protein [Novacetimonas pomaceti]
MTTFVIDLNNRMIASDSRLSVKVSDNLIIAVDTDEDKILVHNGLVFIFAGNGPTTFGWRDWILGETEKFPPFPPKNGHIGAIICAVNISTLDSEMVIGDERIIIRDQERGLLIGGTGRKVAKEDWDKNQNAISSVQAAINRDARTGGTIKYYDILTGKHNLTRPLHSVSNVRRMFRENSIVMYDLEGKKELSAKSEAIRNQEVKNFLYNIGEKEKRDKLGLLETPSWPYEEKIKVEQTLRRLLPERFS